MNVFKAAIDAGKVRDKAALKERFRILAKRLHPDTAKDGAEDGPFIKLRADFEEALAWLSEEALPPAPRRKPPSRRELLEAFWELEASSFPVDPRIRGSSRIYLARIAAFAALLEAAGVLGDHDFRECEEELYRIRGDDIIDNPLFGKIRMLFYNLVSWHLEPRRFTKGAIEKWYAETGPLLLERGYPATHAFVTWLVEDLGNGPALG